MPKFKMRASFSKSCRWCGKSFVPNWSHVRKAWSEYCCKRCGQVGYYEANKTLVHPPFADEVLSELKDLWDGGATCVELMSKYKVGNKYIRRELRRAGVQSEDFRPRGSRGRRPSNSRTYRFDAFSHRDPQTAYWAGFVMADGSVSANGALNISCHEQDADHLVAFAEWIGLSSSDVYRERARNGSGPKAHVRAQHRRLNSDLAEWGIVPRKSYCFCRPEVESKLLPHFVRGWFDGDGCVSLRKGKERCRITGNRTAMEWLAEQLQSLNSFSTAVSDRKDGRVWAKLCVSGANNVLQFIEWVEPWLDPCLGRKWAEAKAWAEKRRKMLAHCKDGRIVRNNLGNGKQVRSHRLHAPKRSSRRSGSRSSVA